MDIEPAFIDGSVIVCVLPFPMLNSKYQASLSKRVSERAIHLAGDENGSERECESQSESIVPGPSVNACVGSIGCIVYRRMYLSPWHIRP